MFFFHIYVKNTDFIEFFLLGIKVNNSLPPKALLGKCNALKPIKAGQKYGRIPKSTFNQFGSQPDCYFKNNQMDKKYCKVIKFKKNQSWLKLVKQVKKDHIGLNG